MSLRLAYSAQRALPVTQIYARPSVPSDPIGARAGPPPRWGPLSTPTPIMTAPAASEPVPSSAVTATLLGLRDPTARAPSLPAEPPLPGRPPLPAAFRAGPFGAAGPPAFMAAALLPTYPAAAALAPPPWSPGVSALLLASLLLLQPPLMLS